MSSSQSSAVFIATRPGSIAMLTLIVAIGQMSIGLYLPSLPSIGPDLGVGRESVQLTLTWFLAGFAIGQLFWGPVADRFGRRPTLFIGLILFTVAGFACIFAESVEQLIALRFVQALGACVGQVIGRASVRDTTEGPDTARVMTYISLALSVSPAVTPALGGLLETHFGWRANFVALAVIGGLLIFLTRLWMPETARTLVPNALSLTGMLRNYGILLRDREYLGYLLVVSGIFGGLMAYTTGSPFILMEQLGWSPQAFGLLTLLNVGAFVAGSLVTSRFAPTFGEERMVRAGCWLTLAAGLSMVTPPMLGHISTAAVIAPAMLFLFAMALTLPNAMAGSLRDFPEIAGSASALVGFCQMGTGMLGSWAVGLIGGDPHWAVAVVLAANGLLCVLATRLLRSARIT